MKLQTIIVVVKILFKVPFLINSADYIYRGFIFRVTARNTNVIVAVGY